MFGAYALIVFVCVVVVGGSGGRVSDVETDDRYAGRGGVFETITEGGSGPAKCTCPTPCG